MPVRIPTEEKATMPPRVSIIIPTLNEAHNIVACLDSLCNQDFDLRAVEVLVADGGSTDGTQELALRFAARLNLQIVDNSERGEAEWGKGLALLQAHGEYFQCVDADMRFGHPELLTRLVAPLDADQGLAGSTAPYVEGEGLSITARFLTFDPLQRDPLLEVLTPAAADMVVQRAAEWSVMVFDRLPIPPVGGTTMFRRSQLNVSRWGGYFLESDHPVSLAKRGHRRFALIESEGVGWIHLHCTGLLDLVRKRMRNVSGLSSSYFAAPDLREVVWLDLEDTDAVRKLAGWMIGTHLIFPRLIEGLWQALRLRRLEPLLRPVVALAVADALLIQLLRSSRTRKFLRSAARGVLR